MRLAVAILTLLCIAGSTYAQTKSKADRQPPSAPSAQPPAPDQRGTDQMPLSVKIIPRAPSKEEAAKEETERLEKASVDKKVAFETQRVADYTWYLAAFTVVLACVAIGQAGLFVWQLSYMKQGMTQLRHEYLICCNAIPAYIARSRCSTGRATTSPALGAVASRLQPGQLIAPRCAVVLRRTRNTDVDLAGHHFFKKSASK
jgi:hypothetical protein